MPYREPDLSPWLEDFQEEEPFLMDVPPMGPAPDPWELPEFETPRGDRFAALLDELMASRMEANQPKGFLDRFALGLQASPPQMQGRPNNGLEAFLGGFLPSAAQGFSQGRVASRGLAKPDLSGRMEMLKLAGMGATQEGQDNARKMSAALRQQGIRSGVEKAAVPKVVPPSNPSADPMVGRHEELRRRGLGQYAPKPGSVSNPQQMVDEEGSIVPKLATPKMAEKAALAFYNRAKGAVDNIEATDASGKSLEQRVSSQGLLRQGQLQYAPNTLKTEDQRLYRQAQRAFTEARLRKESGAAISTVEYENDSKIYFAQPGDDPATRAQKQAARKVVLDGLANSAGPAYDEWYGESYPGKPKSPASDAARTLRNHGVTRRKASSYLDAAGLP